MSKIEILLKSHWRLFKKPARTLIAKLLRFLPVTSERTGPKGCEKARDWIRISGSNKYKASYKEIYPRSEILLRAPKTIDREIHWTYLEASAKRPQAFVVEIPEGRLWSNEWCTDGAIITPDDKVLSDISFQAKRRTKDNVVFNQYPMLPLYYIHGVAADLTAMASGYVYFHWMHDVLPRVHLLQKSNLFRQVDRFIVNQYTQPFQKETLDALGIPETKIVECIKHPYIRADKLIAGSLLSGDNNMPGWACDFLREAFLKDDCKNRRPSRRIYISRADSGGRKIINEPQVLDFLEGYGFEKHLLAGMPVTEQVRLFSDAEVIVSSHGSNLTNIVFCNKDAKLIELFSPAYANNWYRIICSHVGIEYYYMFGKGQRITRDKWHLRSKARDLLVDIDELAETLKLAGIEKKGRAG